MMSIYSEFKLKIKTYEAYQDISNKGFSTVLPSYKYYWKRSIISLELLWIVYFFRRRTVSFGIGTYGTLFSCYWY